METASTSSLSLGSLGCRPSLTGEERNPILASNSPPSPPNFLACFSNGLGSELTEMGILPPTSTLTLSKAGTENRMRKAIRAKEQQDMQHVGRGEPKCMEGKR